MKKQWISLGVALVVIVSSFAAWSAVEAEKKRSSLMQRKLDNAQNLLEALALENFAGIKEAADELNVIAQEARWKKLNTPTYNQLSSEFTAATAKVATMAEEENLDGATLGFVQLTMTCVECHKLVRNSETVAQLPSSVRSIEKPNI